MTSALLHSTSKLEALSCTGPSRWRVAVVGARYIDETHAAILAEAPDVLLTTVIDLRSERAASPCAAVADPWGVLSRLEALAESRDIDVARVLLPPEFHVSAASQLLSAGITRSLQGLWGSSDKSAMQS